MRYNASDSDMLLISEPVTKLKDSTSPRKWSSHTQMCLVLLRTTVYLSELLLSKFVFKWIKRKMINEAKASAKSVWKVLFFIKDGQILPRFCLTTSPSHTVAVSSIRHIQSPSLRHYSEVTRVLEHLTGGSSSTYLQRRTWSCALLLPHSAMQNFGKQPHLQKSIASSWRIL